MLWKMLQKKWSFLTILLIKTLFERLNNVVNSDFGRITYTEAVDILVKSGEKFEYPVNGELIFKLSMKDI